VAVRRRGDRIIRAVSDDYPGVVDAFAFDAPIVVAPDHPFANYVRGVAWALQAEGSTLCGADIAVAGDVPRGAGLSSSASLEVAVGLAFAALAGEADFDRTRLARIAQKAESDFVGVKCGIMDQLISAAGVEGAALLIDCRSLALSPARTPKNVAILIIHSGVVRGLVDSAYNALRRRCEAAARALGVPALRDATDATLAAAHGLDDETFRRARHVVTENQRTLAAADALVAGDLGALGRLMAASHASMRDDFEITTPEIDRLVDILQNAIGAEGGARMTGGGFGGCVVAVCAADRAGATIDKVRRAYAPPDAAPLLALQEKPRLGASLL
ncbi:MAG: galactokinase, partial [Parvularculaceae bacterium]|nr:galactokinase [Parvularculaceae bacterium]